jgi:hypothetical protein
MRARPFSVRLRQYSGSCSPARVHGQHPVSPAQQRRAVGHNVATPQAGPHRPNPASSDLDDRMTCGLQHLANTHWAIEVESANRHDMLAIDLQHRFDLIRKSTVPIRHQPLVDLMIRRVLFGISGKTLRLPLDRAIVADQPSVNQARGLVRLEQGYHVDQKIDLGLIAEPPDQVEDVPLVFKVTDFDAVPVEMLLQNRIRPIGVVPSGQPDRPFFERSGQKKGIQPLKREPWNAKAIRESLQFRPLLVGQSLLQITARSGLNRHSKGSQKRHRPGFESGDAEPPRRRQRGRWDILTPLQAMYGSNQKHSGVGIGRRPDDGLATRLTGLIRARRDCGEKGQAQGCKKTGAREPFPPE